jgi:hypothetical protein
MCDGLGWSGGLIDLYVSRGCRKKMGQKQHWLSFWQVAEVSKGRYGGLANRNPALLGVPLEQQLQVSSRLVDSVLYVLPLYEHLWDTLVAQTQPDVLPRPAVDDGVRIDSSP